MPQELDLGTVLYFFHFRYLSFSQQFLFHHRCHGFKINNHIFPHISFQPSETTGKVFKYGSVFQILEMMNICWC